MYVLLPGQDTLHLVITGGESGPGARPLDLGRVRSIRDQCGKSGVAFFNKQHGGIRPKSGGRELDGRTWDEVAVGSKYHAAELGDRGQRPRPPCATRCCVGRITDADMSAPIFVGLRCHSWALAH